MQKTNLLAVSDLQIPFEHQDAYDFVCHVLKVWFPRRTNVAIYNVGDEVDQHTLGKWTPDPDGMSGSDEFSLAVERLQPWFSRFPNTKICISNHSYRAYKKSAAAGIPSAFMKTIGEAYGAPKGWKWAQRWVHNDILLEHGENVSGINAAIAAAMQNRKKTIIGHQHVNAGVVHSGDFEKGIWGLNTGCLIDVNKYAFSYGKTYRNKPVLGCGLVVDDVPHFVPMFLNKRGRWVGRA